METATGHLGKNWTQKMMPKKYELLFYGILLVHLIVAIIIAAVDPQGYEQGMAREDGYVEWLTVLALVSGTVLCFQRVITLRKEKGFMFLFFTFLLGLIFLFGAGEEISWGQRIFDWTPGEFFQKHNVQSEMNIHNLTIKGKRINKIVFGKGLAILMVTYLLAFPYLYRRKEGFKKFLNRCAAPVAQNHQIIAFLVLVALVACIPSSRKGEMMELGATWLFFLLTLNPLNAKNFQSQ
jgi:hypothetical protein